VPGRWNFLLPALVRWQFTTAYSGGHDAERHRRTWHGRKHGHNRGASGIATDETEELISSNKVEGTAVYNREGERLGTVSSLMVNKFTGQVAYTIMSFGGFLGIGQRCHPLP
jgi:hypothetical protein